MEQAWDIKQRHTYWCGPTCLKIVVETLCLEQGKVWTLDQEIYAKVAGTTSAGTSVSQLKKAIKLFGLDYRIVYAKSKLPRKIVGIFYEKKRDHWMVAVKERTSNFVDIFDPDFGSINTIPVDTFKEVYMSSEWSYLLSCKRKKELVNTYP